MCGIIAATTVERFNQVAKANQKRGRYAYSWCAIAQNGAVIKSEFGRGEMPLLNSVQGAAYYIGHVQAPTGGLNSTEDRIHPSVIGTSALYHNGIIKQSYMKKNGYVGWDTKLLHQKIIQGEIDQVEGSFACLRVVDGHIHIFRNATCILWTDAEMTVSSVKVDDSMKMIPPNRILEADFLSKTFKNVGIFNNADLAYLVKEISHEI